MESKSTSEFVIHEQPIQRALPQVPLQIDVPKTMKSTTAKILDAFVDSVFDFIDLPSQVRF